MSVRTRIWFAGSEEDYVIVECRIDEVAARLNADRRVVSFRSANSDRHIFIAPAHVAMLDEDVRAKEQ